MIIISFDLQEITNYEINIRKHDLIYNYKKKYLVDIFEK